MKPVLRARRGQRGNAMVEFALASLILIPVFANTFQFGYSFYQYLRLEEAVRNAARYAGSRTFNAGSSASVTAFRTAVKQMAVYGNPQTSSGAALVPNLATSHVNVTVADNSGNPASSSVTPRKVSVSVSGFQIYGVFGTVTLSSRPYVEFPYFGQYLPSGME
ncbi:MAG: pilus assembly protein [Acidobacteria bacterium]|nr:pilus assembly protein [Acidobacteriota bacterium]